MLKILKLLFLLSILFFHLSVFSASAISFVNGTRHKLTVLFPGYTRAYIAPGKWNWYWFRKSYDYKFYIFNAMPTLNAKDFSIPSQISTESVDTYSPCSSGQAIDIGIDGTKIGRFCTYKSSDLRYHSGVALCHGQQSDGNTISLGLYASCTGKDCLNKHNGGMCPPRIIDRIVGKNSPMNKYFIRYPLRTVLFRIDYDWRTSPLTFESKYQYNAYPPIKWQRTVKKSVFKAYTLSPEVKFNFNYTGAGVKYIFPSVDVKTAPPFSYGAPCVDLTKNGTLLTLGNKYNSPTLFREFCGDKSKSKTHLFLFHADGTYTRFDDGKVGYTGSTQKAWFNYSAGAPSESDTKIITAVVHWNNLRDYFFFNDGYYVRYNHTFDHGFSVKPTELFLSKLKPYEKQIVAALTLPNFNAVYFFLSNGTYLKIKSKAGSFIGPRTVATGFPGITAQEAKEITAAVNMQNGTSIFYLTGKRYIKYDNIRDKVAEDKDYPAPLPSTIKKQPIAAFLWFGY